MTTDPIGIYNFPLMRRGDTFRGRNIAKFSQDDDALEISAALLQVRTRGRNALVYEWTTEGDTPNAEITGTDSDTVTLYPVSEEITKTWPPGDHVYDLQVTFAVDSAALTMLKGVFPVSADTSIPTV